MRAIRILLLMDALAAALVAAVVLFAVGAPLAATGRLRLPGLAALAVLAALTASWLGWTLLVRSVARPVEQLLAAARGLATPRDSMPVLAPADDDGAASLGVATVAFERVAGALQEERARLAAKIVELERTNRELAEARESWVRSERLAAVGRIGAGLAHEVGNPLGAITGYVELARSRLPDGADPELVGSLDRIGAAAGRIDATIRDLLEFARPSPAALAGVGLAGVVQAVLRLARVQPRFRGIEVEVELPADLPLVRADGHRLSQVLLNLVLNGADAVGAGGHLRLAASLEGADPAQVVITVTDDGPGIAPQDLERVFEPFFTTKEAGRGSGLGLAVSRALVESFGGTIQAGNRQGHGAVFTIRLRRDGERG